MQVPPHVLMSRAPVTGVFSVIVYRLVDKISETLLRGKHISLLTKVRY